MRVIFALLIVLSIFIDFSASYLAEDLTLCGIESVSELSHSHSINASSPASPVHDCPHESESHHCHGGHLHVAVSNFNESIDYPLSMHVPLEFIDYSLAVPSTSLSEIIRPPIPA